MLIARTVLRGVFVPLISWVSRPQRTHSATDLRTKRDARAGFVPDHE